MQAYAKETSSPIDLEKENIEIISVSGKNNLDKFYLLFTELKYSIYVIFDWDNNKKNIDTNKRMTNLLGCTSEFSDSTYTDTFAIFKDDFETELKKNISNYDELCAEGRCKYGLDKERSKEIIARYVANNTEPPEFIKTILNNIKKIKLE